MRQILFPFCMIGRFSDGYEREVMGNDEQDCMYKLITIQDNGNHGELTWYAPVCDENYIDGALMY